MSCEAIRPLIDDYIDDAVDSATHARVAAHLAACPGCAAEERAERRFVAELRGLPESIEPRAEVWQVIEGRLDARLGTWSGGGRRVWAGLAAASVLAAAFAAGYWIRSGPSGREPSPAAAASVPSRHVAPDPGSAAGVLLAVKRDLRASLAERREHLAPQTRVVVERHLAVIERSIAEIERALAADPGDPDLHRMLLAAHRRELDLLRRANWMATNQ
jgi:anti-sigma factor RsiW